MGLSGAETRLRSLCYDQVTEAADTALAAEAGRLPWLIPSLYSMCRGLQWQLKHDLESAALLQVTEATDTDFGSEKEEDCPGSSAPCAKGEEVLIASTAQSGPNGGTALTRHRALSEFTFLFEHPYLVASMLEQVTTHPASISAWSLHVRPYLLRMTPVATRLSNRAVVYFQAQASS